MFISQGSIGLPGAPGADGVKVGLRIYTPLLGLVVEHLSSIKMENIILWQQIVCHQEVNVKPLVALFISGSIKI